jgi:hypothetical protein
MWVANHGDTSMFVTAHPSVSEEEANEYSRLGEIAYAAEKRRGVLAFIAEHPGWVVQMCLRRFVFNWTCYWSLPRGPVVEEFDPDVPFDPANIIFCTILTVLAFVGFRQAFLSQSDTRWLFAFALTFFPFLYYLTKSHLRYRHPIDPELVILAVYALMTLRQRFTQGRPPAPGPWSQRE